MEGGAPKIVIAVGAPKGPGGDYRDDPEAMEAIRDGIRQFFEAGKAGKYDEAAELICMILDIKGGADPYEAGMEYSPNPGFHPSKRGGMKY